MPVHIDDMPVDLDSGPLGEVLLAAQKRMEPQGRIIVEVLLDGRTIVGDELVDRQNEAIDDATLNLLTANPRELVIDTLGETHRMLEAAGEQQAEAADALQRDDEATALERIGEAMTIWQQTERAVSESAMIMEISLDSLRVDDMTFSELTAGRADQQPDPPARAAQGPRHRGGGGHASIRVAGDQYAVAEGD